MVGSNRRASSWCGPAGQTKECDTEDGSPSVLYFVQCNLYSISVFISLFALSFNRGLLRRTGTDLTGIVSVYSDLLDSAHQVVESEQRKVKPL